MSNALENKTAVILGGTSGMGLAAAKRFLAEGAKVIITGRKQEKIDVARQELQGRVAIYQADIADYEATKSAIEQGVERFGKIDVFYQVAGMASMVPFEMADSAHYETMVTVDLVAPIVALLNARPHLNDGAAIILTTTTASTRPAAAATAYCAAKAGLDQFAKALALELAHRKIRVNVISPGPIDTPIFNELGIPQEQLAGFQQFLASIIPLGRLGRDDEIANAALFLASEQSSFVSGVTLQVDGGLNQSFHQMPG
ncbi:MAG: SDR family oxidoreductase [Deltaproteobacteria bacterium]|nr:SDR family oxidoreductase [Deltaproteobacteria bacterium]